MSAGVPSALRGFIAKAANKKLTKDLIPPDKFERKNIRNILIICGNKHLYEVILSLPAFKAIRRRFPNAKITALFEAQFVSFKDQFDACDEIRPFYRQVLAWPFREAVNTITILKTGFDFVIVFNTKGHSYLDAILAHFAQAKYILGSELSIPNGQTEYIPYNLLAPASGKSKHPSEYYRSVLRHIGIKGYRSVNRLPLSGQIQQAAENILHYNGFKPGELIVGISLSPEHDEKSWPIENYVALAKHFSSRMEAKVMTFCNRNDVDIAERFETGLPFKPFRTDEYSLHEQAALMRYCSLIVCTNIDYMYLAYSVGVPVVGLFGALDYKIWQPGNDKFIAINSENKDITSIKTKSAIEAAKKILRAKILNRDKSFDISEQALDDFLGFGDIVEKF